MRSCILDPSTCPTTIDFGPQYASNKTAQEILTHVNQCLQFHGRNKIKKFQIFFCPLDEFLTDIENWVAFAVANGVEELKLDFSMGFDYSEEEFTNGGKSFKLPNILFQCKTLTHLSLSHCDFCPPANFSGFDTLCSLSLTYVSITAEKLQHCISNSPSLECLSLKNCKNLESIIVTSKQLRRLNIVNSLWEASHIEITAPKLESFIYHGTHIFGDLLGYHPYDPFIDISSLSDVFISSIGTEAEHEHDFIKLLYDLRKVKVLTVCTATLMVILFKLLNSFKYY